VAVYWNISFSQCMYMITGTSVSWCLLVALCMVGLYAVAVTVSSQKTALEGFLSSSKKSNATDSGQTKQQMAACAKKSDNVYESLGCVAMAAAETRLNEVTSGAPLSKSDNETGMKTLLKDTKKAIANDILSRTITVCAGMANSGEGPSDETLDAIRQTDVLMKLSAQIDVALGGGSSGGGGKSPVSKVFGF